MKLTIGMATYGDLHGTFFTIQSLRMHHDLTDCEILVIDNKGNKHLEDWVKAWGHNQVRYVKYTDITGTTVPRQKIFEYARGDYVICIDSHVLLMPGALNNITDYMNDGDLIHGPMVYDSLDCYTTHMEPVWRDNMMGIWSDTVKKLPREPFEIPMHGLGLFGCKKDAWLGFNMDFRGFGGEEGYIHEKFKQAGKKIICIPWLIWCHKFITDQPPYPLDLADRIRNYLLGFKELGLDPKPIYDHFGIKLTNDIRQKNKIEFTTVYKNSQIKALTIKEPVKLKAANEIYSYIYGNATSKGLYGSAQRRDPLFYNFIKDNLPKESKVLDAGCGRGFLVRWLNSSGYDAEGTEIADSLFEKGHDLYGMPIKKLFYSEFNTLSDNTYDAVISNDVIEHLESEQDIDNALQHFVRISKNYILISTGGWRGAYCPFPELGIKDLHNIVHPKEWWAEKCKRYFDIVSEFEGAGSVFIFGKKRTEQLANEEVTYSVIPLDAPKIIFPEYPLSTNVGSLRESVTKETLAKYEDIIVGKNKPNDNNDYWSLAWGTKKDHNAVMETGFFWDAMHIDTMGLYKNSSLNQNWPIIESFKAPISAESIIFNSKLNTSKYSQTNKEIKWDGVVLALQNPGDRSVLSCGSIDDYYSFVEKACKAYKKHLFLKMHPWNNGDIKTRFEEIAKRYGCSIDKCNHSVIEKCKFVLVYNSTFAVDCFLRGVNVAQYAPGYWSSLPCVTYTDGEIPYDVNYTADYGRKLVDFLVWKYCFRMNMPIEKWVDMLRHFSVNSKVFPLKEEWSYASNIKEA